jgi:alkylhydroperoxidase/carboxymuconolactone decarboxylase family protein YurZ
MEGNAMAGKRGETQMAQVPPYLRRLQEADPDFAQRVADLLQFASSEGALDANTKTLMSLLADAILGHPDGVAAIADRARQQGVTEAQIAETVRMAFVTAGVPALVTALSAFRR